MRRTLQKALGIVIAVAALMALVACSGQAPAANATTEGATTEAAAEAAESSEGTAAETTTEATTAGATAANSDMVGAYKLVGIVSEGQTVSESDINSLQGDGLFAMLIVNEDNTATLNLFGIETNFTYDDKKFKEETGDHDYTFSNNQLVLGDDKDGMTFARMTDEEVKAAEEANEAIKDMVESFSEDLE